MVKDDTAGRLGRQLVSIGTGSRTVNTVVVKSSVLLTKLSNLHMASGLLIEPQLTVTGPQNSRADPNQKTVSTVVRPFKI
jgi:hypothetical protein